MAAAGEQEQTVKFSQEFFRSSLLVAQIVAKTPREVPDTLLVKTASDVLLVAVQIEPMKQCASSLGKSRRRDEGFI